MGGTQRVTDDCRRQFVGREDGRRGRSMVRRRCGDGWTNFRENWIAGSKVESKVNLIGLTTLIQRRTLMRQIICSKSEFSYINPLNNNCQNISFPNADN